MERVEFGNGLRSHIARELRSPRSPRCRSGRTAEGPLPSFEPAPTQSTSADWVRDLLRERVGEQAERIWAVFDDALRATDADGRPDHALRLRAAWALLAEVYGPPAGAGAELPVGAHRRAREHSGARSAYPELSTSAASSTYSTIGRTPYSPVTRSSSSSVKNACAASADSHT